jgi:hypothetical protein
MATCSYFQGGVQSKKGGVHNKNGGVCNNAHQMGDQTGILGQYWQARGFLYPLGPASPANN